MGTIRMDDFNCATIIEAADLIDACAICNKVLVVCRGGDTSQMLFLTHGIFAALCQRGPRECQFLD